MSNKENERRGPSLTQRLLGLGLAGAGIYYGGKAVANAIMKSAKNKGVDVFDIGPNSTHGIISNMFTGVKDTKVSDYIARATKTTPGFRRTVHDFAYKGSRSKNALDQFAELNLESNLSINTDFFPNKAYYGTRRAIDDKIKFHSLLEKISKINTANAGAGQLKDKIIGLDIEYLSSFGNKTGKVLGGVPIEETHKSIFQIAMGQYYPTTKSSSVYSRYIKPNSQFKDVFEDIGKLFEEQGADVSLKSLTGAGMSSKHIQTFRQLERFAKASGTTTRDIFTNITESPFENVTQALYGFGEGPNKQTGLLEKLGMSRLHEADTILTYGKGADIEPLIKYMKPKGENIGKIMRANINVGVGVPYIEDLSKLKPFQRMQAAMQQGLGTSGERMLGLKEVFRRNVSSKYTEDKLSNISRMFNVEDISKVHHSADIDVIKTQGLFREMQEELLDPRSTSGNYFNINRFSKDIGHLKGQKFLAELAVPGSGANKWAVNRGDIISIEDIRDKDGSISFDIKKWQAGKKGLTELTDDAGKIVTKTIGGPNVNREDVIASLLPALSPNKSISTHNVANTALAPNVHNIDSELALTQKRHAYDNTMRNLENMFTQKTDQLLPGGKEPAMATTAARQGRDIFSTFKKGVQDKYGDIFQEIDQLAKPVTGEYSNKAIKKAITRDVMRDVFEEAFPKGGARALPNKMIKSTPEYIRKSGEAFKILPFHLNRTGGFSSINLQFKKEDITETVSLYDAIMSGRVRAGELRALSHQMAKGEGYSSREIGLVNQYAKTALSAKKGNLTAIGGTGNLAPVEQYIEQNLDQLLKSRSFVEVSGDESFRGLAGINNLGDDPLEVMRDNIQETLNIVNSDELYAKTRARLDKVKSSLDENFLREFAGIGGNLKTTYGMRGGYLAVGAMPYTVPKSKSVLFGGATKKFGVQMPIPLMSKEQAPVFTYQTKFDALGRPMKEARNVTATAGDVVLSRSKLDELVKSNILPKSAREMLADNVIRDISGEEIYYIGRENTMGLLSRRYKEITDEYSMQANQLDMMTSNPEDYNRNLEAIRDKIQRKINKTYNSFGENFAQNLEKIPSEQEILRYGNIVNIKGAVSGLPQDKAKERMLAIRRFAMERRGENVTISAGKPGQMRKIGIPETTFLGFPQGRKFQEYGMELWDPDFHKTVNARNIRMTFVAGSAYGKQLPTPDVTMTNAFNMKVAIPMSKEAIRKYHMTPGELQGILYRKGLAKDISPLKIIKGTEDLAGVKMFTLGEKGVLGNALDRLPGEADVLLNVSTATIAEKHANFKALSEGIINRMIYEQNLHAQTKQGLAYNELAFDKLNKFLRKGGVGLDVADIFGKKFMWGFDELKRLTSTDELINELDLKPMAKALGLDPKTANKEDVWGGLYSKLTKEWGNITEGTDIGPLFDEGHLVVAGAARFPSQVLESDRFYRPVGAEAPVKIPAMKGAGLKGVSLSQADIFSMMAYGDDKFRNVIGDEVLKSVLSSNEYGRYVDVKNAAASTLLSGTLDIPEEISGKVMGADEFRESFFNRYQQVTQAADEINVDADVHNVLNAMNKQGAKIDVMQRNAVEALQPWRIAGMKPGPNNRITVRLKDPVLGLKGKKQLQHITFHENVFAESQGQLIPSPSTKEQLRLMQKIVNNEDITSGDIRRLTKSGWLEELSGKSGLASSLENIRLGSARSLSLTAPGEIGTKSAMVQSIKADRTTIERIKEATGIEVPDKAILMGPEEAIRQGLGPEDFIKEKGLRTRSFAIKHPTKGIGDIPADVFAFSAKEAEEIGGLGTGTVMFTDDLLIRINADNDGDFVTLYNFIKKGEPGEGNRAIHEAMDSAMDSDKITGAQLWKSIGDIQRKQDIALGKYIAAGAEEGLTPADAFRRLSEARTGVEGTISDIAQTTEDILATHTSTEQVGVIGKFEKDLRDIVMNRLSPGYVQSPEQATYVMKAISELKEVDFIKKMKEAGGEYKSINKDTIIDTARGMIEKYNEGGAPKISGASAEQGKKHMEALIDVLDKKDFDFDIAAMSTERITKAFREGAVTAENLEEYLLWTNTGEFTDALQSKVKQAGKHTDIAYDMGVILSEQEEAAKAAKSGFFKSEAWGVGKALGIAAVPLMAMDLFLGLTKKKVYRPSIQKSEEFKPPDSEYYRTIIEADAMSHGTMNTEQLKEQLAHTMPMHNSNANVNIRDDRESIRSILDREIENKLKGW